MNTDVTHSAARGADDSADGMTAGILLIATSVLAMLMIMHHPQVETHEAGKVMEEIAAKAWIDRLVHGSLILLVSVQAYCYSGFCLRLGISHGPVRAGIIAYGIGIVGIVVATTIDGFVISDMAVRYAAAHAEDLEAARHLLNLCALNVRAFTSLAAVAMSAAFVLWSCTLLRAPRPNAWLGVCGLLLGAGPALAVMFGAISMNLQGAILFLACQSLWNLAVGITLVRGKL
jgi:hypothetical protein